MCVCVCIDIACKYICNIYFGSASSVFFFNNRCVYSKVLRSLQKEQGARRNQRIKKMSIRNFSLMCSEMLTKLISRRDTNLSIYTLKGPVFLLLLFKVPCFANFGPPSSKAIFLKCLRNA